jgi:hypothetical protein
MHIACLIIALLYKFAPEFLKEGRLCWLHAPLFKVTSGKTTKYFYTEEQVNQAKITGTRSRFKGLGEMKDEDSRVMFGPDQWLEQLSWDDSVAGLIEDLMGDDSQPKRILYLAELTLRIWWSNGVLYITSPIYNFYGQEIITRRGPLYPMTGPNPCSGEDEFAPYTYKEYV